MTQGQLAAQTGMKPSAINRMFSGRLSPSLDALLNVANALEVEIKISNLQ